MPTASEWIDTVIAKADGLRKAGVSAITIDGCSVVLLPAELGEDTETKEPVVEPDTDALSHPATYPGGKVPGFTREKGPNTP